MHVTLYILCYLQYLSGEHIQTWLPILANTSNVLVLILFCLDTVGPVEILVVLVHMCHSQEVTHEVTTPEQGTNEHKCKARGTYVMDLSRSVPGMPSPVNIQRTIFRASDSGLYLVTVAAACVAALNSSS